MHSAHSFIQAKKLDAHEKWISNNQNVIFTVIFWFHAVPKISAITSHRAYKQFLVLIPAQFGITTALFYQNRTKINLLLRQGTYGTTATVHAAWFFQPVTDSDPGPGEFLAIKLV